MPHVGLVLTPKEDDCDELDGAKLPFKVRGPIEPSSGIKVGKPVLASYAGAMVMDAGVADGLNVLPSVLTQK